MRTFLWLALASWSGPARAEILPGTVALVAFEIKFSGSVVGHVVVVGEDCANPPAGYSAGNEYWTWTSGTPWRGAFKLVPVSTVPSHGSYSWKVFSHAHFDMSDTIPFPSISPAPVDGFWKVSVDTGSSWAHRGYLWLIDGSPLTQEWYGVNLTHDLIGDGNSEILFVSDEVPDASSLEVYLLE